MTKTLLALLVCVSSCRSVAVRPEDDRARVEAVLRAYESAYNAHDAAALARVHAPDGGYYVAGGEPVVGRAELETFWSKSMGGSLTLALEKHESDGAVAWAVGRWTMGEAAHGRFVLALRRNEAGEYEIVVDMNNESRR